MQQATRKVLLEAALAEMIESGGLETPSIEAICKRAGYTRGTFYLYFRDREQLNEELLEWVLSDVLGAIFLDASRESTDPSDVIDRFHELLASGEWPDVEADLRSAYLAVMRGLEPGRAIRERHAEIMSGLIDRLAGDIRESQESGKLRADVDARNLAVTLVLTSIGAIMWSGVEIEFEPAALGQTLLMLLAPIETSL